MAKMIAAHSSCLLTELWIYINVVGHNTIGDQLIKGHRNDSTQVNGLIPEKRTDVL